MGQTKSAIEQRLETGRKTRVLVLKELKLKKVPAKALAIERLRTLDLSGNMIESLPPSFGSLVALTSLTLSGNRLEALPVQFVALVKLDQLSLDNNRLSLQGLRGALPPGVTKLSLAGNRLAGDLDVELPAKVQALDLSGNALTGISAGVLAKLGSLKELTLDNNRLAAVSEDLGVLKKLQVLAVRRNQILHVAAPLFTETPVDRYVWDTEDRIGMSLLPPDAFCRLARICCPQ